MAPVIDPKAVSRAALAAFARRHGVLLLALFGRPVDLVTRVSLKPRVRASVDREAVVLYEA